MPRKNNLEVAIPTMDWEQIGGDMDPGAHGGTIARGDGDRIDLVRIQPVREHVGDREAADVGFPFWTKEATFDARDLDPNRQEVQDAMRSVGLERETLEELSPTQRALALSEALLDWGRGDEGPSGWSKDIGIPDAVKWWGNHVAGAEYLADEDEAFRDEVLGWGEIKEKIEEEVDRMADESAAHGWSHVGDQLASDLEADGFDPATILVEARFGDAVAVNEDLLVGPHWASVLGYSATDLWNEVDTDKLSQWLEDNGYEYVDKAGGRIPVEEGYAYAEHVLNAVEKEVDFPREDIEEAAESFDWWQEEIPRSVSGSTYVWAKRQTADVEERRRRVPAPHPGAAHGLEWHRGRDDSSYGTVDGERQFLIDPSAHGDWVLWATGPDGVQTRKLGRFQTQADAKDAARQKHVTETRHRPRSRR